MSAFPCHCGKYRNCQYTAQCPVPSAPVQTTSTLREELLRALTTARRAYDDCVVALRAASTPGDKERIQQVLHGLGDTVNAVQGCVYSANAEQPSLSGDQKARQL